MSLLLELDEVGSDESLVGGKVLALVELHRAGIVVPHTWCLTTEAYRLFVDTGALRPVIHQELGRKRFEDMRWEEIWDVALRIRNRFLRTPIPDEVVRVLSDRLPDGASEQRFVVRSSARGEDSPGASFAGLHDSFVGVRGVEGVSEAVRGVWASLWTDRALLYRRELGIDPDTSTMAVAIQGLIEGFASGVAFGAHPTNTELAVVEAVYGLNQGLVDGAVEPDRWILERGTGRVVEHVPPESRRRLVFCGSGTCVEDAPPALHDAPPLEDRTLAAVANAVESCGDLFGTPQDVEWTIDDARLVLLQSRPITTSTDEGDDPRSWYISLSRSVETLKELAERVEQQLLPAMDREATELTGRDLHPLEDEALAEEIEHRRAVHDSWVDVYWKEFIPLAHGIRLFGQFYNQVVKPEDPYEFMELLSATPMMAVRRNLELQRLASLVRDDAPLRRRLEDGRTSGVQFEAALESFEREHGDAVFAGEHCFRDRRRLVRLLLSLADAPSVGGSSAQTAVERRIQRFFDGIDEDRRDTARELLDLGRLSYRIRDDDNLHLGRLEALVLAAVDEGRRRLRDRHGDHPSLEDLEQVVHRLRHPNLIAEPPPQTTSPPQTPGFRARARQLVGQPAGPGVAVGSARVIAETADLFDLKPGEILVCDAVDPNMTFVVPISAGIVERRGGMLIHGAIIAREYGLPCVTGVPGATELIATGDRMTVDGYLGIVTVTETRRSGPARGG